jgi:hypothetical protein
LSWQYFRLFQQNRSPAGIRPLPHPGPLKTRLCCKSPKTLCGKISAERQNKRQPSIDVASNAQPKSWVSSSQNEVVPHINIRSPSPRPRKFVIGETKGVFATQSTRKRTSRRSARGRGPANPPNAAPCSELGRRPRQELPVVALLLPVHQDV